MYINDQRTRYDNQIRSHGTHGAQKGLKFVKSGCFDVSRCFPPFVAHKGPDMNTSARSSRGCLHFPLRNASLVTLQVGPTGTLQ